MARSAASPVDRLAAVEERRARRAATTDSAVVMDAAARFLAVRSRSVAETRRRLLDLGYATALVETVLERMGGLGYLDDRAFARAWVESRDRSRPRGSSALREELRRKGVPDEIVRETLSLRSTRGVHDTPQASNAATGATGPAGALDRTPTPPDLAAAQQLLARRSSALEREHDPRRRRHKAYALLARNGFDPDVCRQAVAQLDSSEAQDDPSD